MEPLRSCDGCSGNDPTVSRERVELVQRAAAVLPINGRHLAAGIAALEVPDDPLAAVWHVGDFLREYRGDCHNASWMAAGLGPTDIGMLTELSWGMPTRSYSRTRGWTTEEFDRSEHRLRDLGYLDGSGTDTHLSQQGRHAREQIEAATDEQMRPALDALGDDAEELFDLLTPWGDDDPGRQGLPRRRPPRPRLIDSSVWAPPGALGKNGVQGRASRPIQLRREGVAMTNQHPATVADSLSLHGDIHDGEFDEIVDHWAKLDARLRSFDAGTVSLQLFVKERDTRSQHVTLEVKIDGHNPLVATSSSTDFVHALNEVRDEMIRQITDMKTKKEPRNNKHLRDNHH
jgi:ribosome-associated translation inhibitor RaiA